MSEQIQSRVIHTASNRLIDYTDRNKAEIQALIQHYEGIISTISSSPIADQQLRVLRLISHEDIENARSSIEEPQATLPTPRQPKK